MSKMMLNTLLQKDTVLILYKSKAGTVLMCQSHNGSPEINFDLVKKRMCTEIRKVKLLELQGDRIHG